MAKKSKANKKKKNPVAKTPEVTTIAPEVNAEDIDPQKKAKLEKAAAEAAAEAAAVTKQQAAEEKKEAARIAPNAGKDDKKKKKSKKQPDYANKSKDKKSAKGKNGKDSKKQKAFVRWWKELGAEMKKIHWSNGKDTVKNTLIVLLVILVIGIGVWIVDWLLVKARTGIYDSAANQAQQAVMALRALVSYVGIGFTG